MPLLIKNICVGDAINAKELADSLFPLFHSAGAATSVTQVVSLTSSSLNFVTGVYTYSTKNQLGAVLNTNSTMTFPACADAEITLPFTEIFLIISLIFLYFLGFKIGNS